MRIFPAHGHAAPHGARLLCRNPGVVWSVLQCVLQCVLRCSVCCCVLHFMEPSPSFMSKSRCVLPIACITVAVRVAVRVAAADIHNLSRTAGARQ